MVPVINKPTHMTKTTTSATDHIITNSSLHRTIDMGVIKLHILDHFSIFLVAGTEKRMTPNNETKENFKNNLQKMT